MTIRLIRVIYGKPNTPKELREYQINGYGPVGTISEFKKVYPAESFRTEERKIKNLLLSRNEVESILSSEIGPYSTKKITNRIMKLKPQSLIKVEKIISSEWGPNLTRDLMIKFKNYRHNSLMRGGL